ncbi:hypothetical protein [Pseudomonas sp. ANT_H12B]|uniref:RCC1 domain-containing protein n=1 Tax=Pseudomonas sp. ANT_H12B TaxID=2597348 RepID=UPI0011EFF242|nr:hypothetical protein [Pseudomonas sp. ANT_H12B]KAA0974020.1 hypothetical protein FQ185_13815 [Pseudomonas sp. ANT_H12B]
MTTDESNPGVLAIDPPRFPNATDPITPYPAPSPGIHYVGLRQAAFDIPLARDPTRQNATKGIGDPPLNADYESIIVMVNDEPISTQFVAPADRNEPFYFNLPQSVLNEGLNDVKLRYQRGSGNFTDSKELGVQYHRNLPGGNEVPGTGDHPALDIAFASQLGNPPLIGIEELTNGLVKLILDYPFKRPHDRIKLEINNVPFFFTVQPGEEGKPYVITLTLEMYNTLQKPSTLSINYTVTDQLGNPTHLRRWSKKITAEVDPVDGELSVMGARVASVQYWANKGGSRYITALDVRTGRPLRARWRYEGATEEVATAHFDDTQPERLLHVRYGARSVAIKPANFYGNGLCDLNNFSLAHSAFVALQDNGKLTAWGLSASGGSLPASIIPIRDVIEVVWSSMAFAVLRANGSVMAWGNPITGGEVPQAIAVLSDIRRICSGGQAIAALRADSSVVAWGNPACGGLVPAAISQLKNIRQVSTSGAAFAVQLADGSVRAWGEALRGGLVPADIARLTNIAEVVNNHDAFAALCTDGSVVAWGSEAAGAKLPVSISNVVRIISAGYAFVAHLDSGHVVAWGRPDWGGSAPASILALDNIIDVVGAGYAFAAILTDYRVVAWGDSAQGGVVPASIAALRNIVQLATTNGAFAALCADGTVVTWGNPVWGGDSSRVANQLVNVVAIYSNAEAFVALASDGRVVTWGLAGSGGNSDAVRDELFRQVSYLAPAVSQGMAGNTVAESGAE